MTDDIIRDQSFERALPNSAEAERALLGAVLLDNALILQAARLLRPDDFYVPSHRKIFIAMLILMEADKPIEPILIGEELKKENSLESVGGISFITNLTYGLPHSTNIKHYANIVRGHAKMRWLIKLFNKSTVVALEGDMHPDELAEQVVREISDTGERLRDLRRPRSIDEMYDDQAMRFLLFHKGVTDAISTGFPEIDEKLLGGGFLPSLEYLLAGRPSMGKTTLALDFVGNAADAGRRCMVVSKESPAEMLLDRMVAAKAGIDRFKVSAGMTKRSYELAMETLQAMRLVPIVFDDTSSTIQDLDRWLAEYERSGNRIELLMCDYLQLMSGSGDSMVQQVSGVSKGFKGLLTKYKLPGILISNLSRGGGDREPEVTHLRESGQIEFDADVIMFVHGDQTEEELDFLDKELICKKQRDGPHFRRQLSMNSKLVTFRSPDMLGLTVTDSGIQPRRMGSDEEELAKQKARGEGAGKKKRPGSQDETFDF